MNKSVTATNSAVEMSENPMFGDFARIDLNNPPADVNIMNLSRNIDSRRLLRGNE